jgi:hypothetical protein
MAHTKAAAVMSPVLPVAGVKEEKKHSARKPRDLDHEDGIPSCRMASHSHT